MDSDNRQLFEKKIHDMIVHLASVDSQYDTMKTTENMNNVKEMYDSYKIVTQQISEIQYLLSKLKEKVVNKTDQCAIKYQSQCQHQYRADRSSGCSYERTSYICEKCDKSI